VKNNLMPFFFSLFTDPLTAGVIDQRPGGGDRNDAHGNGFGCFFFMFVYAHDKEIGVMEFWSTGVLNIKYGSDPI
jgi:hypothetical protein